MNRQSIVLKICIVCVVALMAGCKQNSSTPIEPQSLLTYQPKGTITGLIVNRITNVPVKGAVISVGYDGGVQSVTSDGAGAYSFANVPVGQYQIVNGTAVFSGTYTLTVSLVAYNAAQTDSSKKYRNYYYSNVTITFTSLASGDSAVSDMVGSALLQISYLNTTVTGQVVDQNQQPVANATVMLFDATVFPNVLIGQTTTSASGNYLFPAVDNGLTVVLKSRSSDGSLQGTLAAFTLPANAISDSLRSQVAAERLMITPVDNVNPFVIGLTPENNSDVSPNNLQVVYTFSEPIKQRAYTRTDLPLGSNTIIDDIKITYLGLKKTATAVTFSAQWNAGFTQLTITPQGIVGSAKYSVDLTAAFNSGNLTDNANLAVVNNPQIIGDFEAMQFTTNGASPVPAAPALTRRLIAGVLTNLDFGGGAVGLEWNYDASARSYNIYWSVDGGSFQLLQSDFTGIQFNTNSGSLVYPSAAVNPLRASSVQYLVRGVSKDLVEGPSSNIITVADVVKPQLLGTSSVAAAGGTNSWTYTLRFTEPLTISTAETIGNYSFGNTGGVVFTVNTANYLGFVGGSYVVQLGVTTSAALPVGYVIFVGNNVTDLAGNSIDQTANSKTF
ncbi:MAG TPA: carboxypeptidase-like regulatory domain-containing protein [Bacteroidota bacterium]|nr:carboxypeptidase-like regulatory domain-containing protein [Bacteroidota bacterium]